jgi:ATP-dependent phosphofructokinase / diphosphate-dependent phosphofructokinase
VPDCTGERVRRSQAGGEARYGRISHILGEAIAGLTGAETRVMVLGHAQRGGQPTWDDRLIASAFGIYAVDLIAAGRFDRMVAWQNRRVVDGRKSAAGRCGRHLGANGARPRHLPR